MESRFAVVSEPTSKQNYTFVTIKALLTKSYCMYYQPPHTETLGSLRRFTMHEQKLFRSKFIANSVCTEDTLIYSLALHTSNIECGKVINEFLRIKIIFNWKKKRYTWCIDFNSSSPCS